MRRWIPELAHLSGKAAHEPWDVEDGYAHDYPKRIIDHAEERQVGRWTATSAAETEGLHHLVARTPPRALAEV